MSHTLNKPVVIIGDIHECVSELKKLIAKVKEKYGDNVEFWSIGDWLDKNDNTKEIIDFLLENPQIELITGNHEHYVYQRFKNLKKEYKYMESDVWFTSIPFFLNNPEYINKLNELYERSLPYHVIKNGDLTYYLTHSPCPEEYLGKDDPKSLKRQRKQDFSWDRKVPTLQQLDYLWKEGDENSSIYHIFGHVQVSHHSHVFKNKIFLDTACVEGNYMTAVILKQNQSELEFISVASDNFNSDINLQLVPKES